MAETTWWYQRAYQTLRDPGALAAWGRAAVPDTIAEWWNILLLFLVGVFAVSCIDTMAQAAQAQEREEKRRAETVRSKEE